MLDLKDALAHVLYPGLHVRELETNRVGMVLDETELVEMVIALFIQQPDEELGPSLGMGDGRVHPA